MRAPLWAVRVVMTTSVPPGAGAALLGARGGADTLAAERAVAARLDEGLLPL